MDPVKLSENAAAIAASVHQHPDYQAAYEQAKDAVCGFPGIWKACARLGVLVTKTEEKGILRFDESAPEWVEFIDRLADKLVGYLKTEGRDPGEIELTELVAQADLRI
jgi:hypothetical protein